MSIYLKIVTTEWKSSTHDKRELRVAQELGHKCIVLANTKKNHIFWDQEDCFDILRIPTRSFGYTSLGILLGRIYAIILMIVYANKMDASFISGHNYSGWIIGYMSCLFKKDCKLIYDSHELELYQHGTGKLRFCMIYLIEYFIFRKSVLSYIVTDSASEKVKNIYRLEHKPLVIRNIPEYSQLDQNEIKKCREEFFSNLNISSDGTIVMYHGGFTPARGVEQAIIAVSKTKNTGLVLLGYSLDDTYMNEIINLINDCQCRDRVYIKPAVPFSSLYNNVAAADIGIVLSKNTCLNHYYSLPNKLFENIQSLTPVIASDFPEISSIVKKYNVGVVINPDNINELIDAINCIKISGCDKFDMHLEKARQVLSWENEKCKLHDALSLIM